MASGAVVIITLLALWWRARCGLQPRFWGGRHPSRGLGEGITVRCAGRGGPGAAAPTWGARWHWPAPAGALASLMAHSAALSWKAAHAPGASELGVLQPVCGLLRGCAEGGPQNKERPCQVQCLLSVTPRAAEAFETLSGSVTSPLFISASQLLEPLPSRVGSPLFLGAVCEQKTNREVAARPAPPLAGFPVRTPRRGARGGGGTLHGLSAIGGPGWPAASPWEPEGLSHLRAEEAPSPCHPRNNFSPFPSARFFQLCWLSHLPASPAKLVKHGTPQRETPRASFRALAPNPEGLWLDRPGILCGRTGPDPGRTRFPSHPVQTAHKCPTGLGVSKKRAGHPAPPPACLHPQFMKGVCGSFPVQATGLRFIM